ncbi:MAG: hypothetical protein ABFS16_00620 [Bacteroidota bacterium]
MNKILIVIVLFVFVGCISDRNDKMSITINSRKTLDIPSGSGIIMANNEFLIVGDDTPWLFALNNNNIVTKRSLISISGKDMPYRADKSQKLDFEDISYVEYDNNEYIFVISSGSKAVFRDTVFILDITSPNRVITKKNIRPLFDKMTETAGIVSINIEGLTSDSETIYIAHRGNHDKNVIFSFSIASLVEYILKDGDVPQFSMQIIELPAPDNLKAGFSALEYVEELKSLLFTASLESSPDSYSDGEVLGSYIGCLSCDKPDKMQIKMLKNSDNIPVKTKLEGITLARINEPVNTLGVVCVSDNDDGKTELLSIEIFLSTQKSF